MRDAWIFIVGLSAVMLQACAVPRAGESLAPEPSAFEYLKDATVGKVEALRRRAEADEPRAQFLLAMAHEYGRGVMPDTEAALAWYAKSAERGYCPARRVLAQKYLFGDDVAKDYVQAFRWYETLAKEGHAFAISMTALMHREGWGVARSTAQARYWEDRLEDAELNRRETANWADPEAACRLIRSAVPSAAVATLTARLHLQGHIDPVVDVAFSGNGRLLYSAGEGDEVIVVWDLERGTKLSEVVVPGDPLGIALHGERVLVKVLGKRVVVGRITAGRFEQQDVLDGRLGRFPFLKWPLSAIAEVEGPDGKLYVDSRTGRRLHSAPPGPGGAPSGIAVSPGLERIVYSMPDGSGSLRVWDVAGAREERRIAGHYPVWIMAVAYSPNGRYVATSGNNMSQVGGATTSRSIRLWDVASGSEVRGFLAADGVIMLADTLSFSPDGTRLAAVGTDFMAGYVYIFDVESGRELGRVKSPSDKEVDFRSLAFSPDSRELAVAWNTGVWLYPLPAP